MGFILDFLVAVVFLVILAVLVWVVWRIAKGHAKLEASRSEENAAHKHVWSPWEDHEVALWDGDTLVRYAPGQLRTCLDVSCNTEDVRMIGGQTTSGNNDAT